MGGGFLGEMNLHYTQPNTTEENKRDEISVLSHNLVIYYVITFVIYSSFALWGAYCLIHNLVANKFKFYTTEILSLALSCQRYN